MASTVHTYIYIYICTHKCELIGVYVYAIYIIHCIYRDIYIYDMERETEREREREKEKCSTTDRSSVIAS